MRCFWAISCRCAFLLCRSICACTVPCSYWLPECISVRRCSYWLGQKLLLPWHQGEFEEVISLLLKLNGLVEVFAVSSFLWVQEFGSCDTKKIISSMSWQSELWSDTEPLVGPAESPQQLTSPLHQTDTFSISYHLIYAPGLRYRDIGTSLFHSRGLMTPLKGFRLQSRWQLSSMYLQNCKGRESLTQNELSWHPW